MTDNLNLSAMLEVFLEEADEQLLCLDKCIILLEKKPDDLSLVNETFRAAHTLKGSSATMGLGQIATLTHAMENLLDNLRSGSQKVSSPVIDALLKGVDLLRVLVQQSHDGAVSTVPMDDVLELLKSVVEVDQSIADTGTKSRTGITSVLPSKPAKDCIRICVRIAETCLMPSVRAFMVFNALAGKGSVVASDPQQNDLDSMIAGGILTVDFNPSISSDEVIEALNCISEIEVSKAADNNESPSDAPDAKPGVDASKAEPDLRSHAMQTVRVAVDRLDNLMNLVGEMVIGRTRVEQLCIDLSAHYEGDFKVDGLREASIFLGRVTTELQEQIMKIRMLPVEQVFNRFPRMMRDLGQSAGKKIDFLISGQETELDRSILEDIVDPITHLLRNAVDHGLETSEERLAIGKPEVGTIRLAAKHEENHIVIEVEDDGKGMSADAIRDAAVAKHIIPAEIAERLSNKDCLQLIFAAGVSTAKNVSDISGRGVGMDVVKSNIERLAGKVDIETELGVGTRIRIKLPLTLAIVQALITTVQGQVYAIPLNVVVETSRCTSSDVLTIGGQPVLQYRESVLPLVHLASIFQHKSTGSHGAKNETILVVVKTSGQQIGLVVDELIGEQEVVIKPLGSYFSNVSGISGAALLGDGRIALIADVASLPALLQREINCKSTK